MSVPLHDWSVGDVKAWFRSYKGGKYASEAGAFEGLDGDELADLTEAQFKSRSLHGDVLFNAIARLKQNDELGVEQFNERSSNNPPPPPPREYKAPAVVDVKSAAESILGPFQIAREPELAGEVVVDLKVNGEKRSITLRHSMMLGDVRSVIRGKQKENASLPVAFILESKPLLLSRSLLSLPSAEIVVTIGEQPGQVLRIPRFYNVPENFRPPVEIAEVDGKEDVKLQVGDVCFTWRLDPLTTLGEFREKIRAAADDFTLLVDFYFQNKPQPIKKSVETFSELEVRIGDQSPQTLKFVKITGQLQGAQCVISPNGDIYDGDWVNGVKCGWGTQTWSDGASFEGQWSEGKAHGRGVYTYPNGAVYDGQWEEGRKRGFGRCIYTHGAVYEGEWNHVKQGYGKQTYPNGKVYEGYWKNNKRDGKGKQTRPDGSIVLGEWINNKHVKATSKVLPPNPALASRIFELGKVPRKPAAEAPSTTREKSDDGSVLGRKKESKEGVDDVKEKVLQSQKDAIAAIRKAMFSKDFHAVISAMRAEMGNAEVQSVGCAALTSLTTGWKTELLQAQAFTLSCEIMRMHPESPEVQAAGCQLIGLLVENMTAKKLGQYGVDLLHGHAMVLQSFHRFPHDPSLAQQAAIALAALASSNGKSGLLMSGDVAGAYSCLFTALDDHSRNQLVVEEACSALRNITFDATDTVMRDMLAAQLHQHILAAMVTHPESPRVIHDGMHIIQHIARGYGVMFKRNPEDVDPQKLLAQAEADAIVKGVIENHGNNPELVKLAKLTLKKLA